MINVLTLAYQYDLHDRKSIFIKKNVFSIDNHNFRHNFFL